MRDREIAFSPSLVEEPPTFKFTSHTQIDHKSIQDPSSPIHWSLLGELFFGWVQNLDLRFARSLDLEQNL